MPQGADWRNALAAEAVDATVGEDGSVRIEDGEGSVVASFGQGSPIRKARGRARGLN